VRSVDDPISGQLRQEARAVAQPFAMRRESPLDPRAVGIDLLAQIDPCRHGLRLPHHVARGPAVVGAAVGVAQRRAFAG